VIDHGKVIAQGTPTELKGRVGGERLEVKLEDQAQGEQAIDVLAALSDERPAADGDMVTLAVRGRNGTIVDAVQRLGAAGVGVADIGLRTPTMDDVFLSLTGRAVEAEATDEEEAAA